MGSHAQGEGVAGRRAGLTTPFLCLTVRPRPGQDGAQAGVDGTVSGWEEAKINSSNPLRYDCQTGQFTVTRAGLYYLYCQVSPTWLHG